MNGRLYRSRDDRVIAGVAGGLADYFDMDPSIVRILWVILALFSAGAFLIVYIAMALVVPEEPWGAYPPPGMPPATGEPMAPGATTAHAEGATGGGGAPGAEGGPPAPGGHASDWRAQRAAWRAQRRAERAAWRAHGGEGGRMAGLVFGAILVAIGLVFLAPVVFPGLTIGRFWPLILVALGAILVVAALRPGAPRQP
jgi:phage shock protein PspC (stress-responsive transcriptional regulator)